MDGASKLFLVAFTLFGIGHLLNIISSFNGSKILYYCALVAWVISLVLCVLDVYKSIKNKKKDKHL